MKCYVRFTCLHTNCSKLVLHFLCFTHVSSFIHSFVCSFVHERIFVCQMFVVLDERTHAPCSSIYGFKIFWSKMLEIMSKDTRTQQQHQHIYIHMALKNTNMSAKIQTFRKIWIDHTHTLTHRDPHSNVGNLYKFMHYHVWKCVCVFVLFLPLILSPLLSLIHTQRTLCRVQLFTMPLLSFEMWHIIMLKRFIHVFALIMWGEIKIYAMPARLPVCAVSQCTM